MATGKIKWTYLLTLSIIWGSSFILIKKGLVGLSPLQVGAFRILFSALFLVIVGFKKLCTIKTSQWKWIVISGLMGSFFPIFLFSFAETKISSGVASILNALTPLMTLVLGVLFFQHKMNKNKTIGILLGLLGAVGLILSSVSINNNTGNYIYSILGVLAALCYGINVNIVKKYLSDVPAVAVTSGSFAVLIIPALLILSSTGFFTQDLSDGILQKSIGFVAILGMLGTGVAMILFNRLVQISNPVFTSSVTYLIPIIALSWGVLDGESFSGQQLLFAMLIVLGVLVVNRSKTVVGIKKKRIAIK